MTDSTDTGAGEDPVLEPIDEEQDEGGGDGDDGLLDRMRGTGVGVEDPNIVGDAGPTDVPPGRDTPGDGLLAEPPDEL